MRTITRVHELVHEPVQEEPLESPEAELLPMKLLDCA
jgi:hypothetical protein